MNTPPPSAQDPSPTQHLSIGDLAERTGLSPATIRMWETRHGFPRPRRLDSGHRRYRESDVEAVAHVALRRDSGVRLDVAITEAMAAARPTSPSVFAELRRRHPQLEVHRLRKQTLLALSWAIEDEFCAKATRPHLFGVFQQERHYTASQDRWRELARCARSTFVFADFDTSPSDPPPGPVRVPLPPDAPMRREWAVVCDSVELPIALTAWELPGQGAVPDRDRMFESIWTVDPDAVRRASRVCAMVASEIDGSSAAPLLYELAEDPPPGTTNLAAVTSVFNRVVAYVDRFGTS